MEFRILGTLEASSDDGLVDLGPPKQRALLAALLLQANQVVPTDQLVEQVWGRAAPRTADHSVQLYVSALRRALGGDVIETRPPGYRLRVDPESIDAKRFEQLVAEGMRDAAERRSDTAAGRFQRALGLWRSPPLADFAYEEFAAAHIRRLEETRARAEEELATLALEAGDLAEALRLADDLAARHPFRERPQRLLMVALYRSGRQADALRSYAAFRRRLAEEVGIEPSPELRRLEEQVLLQDPALAPPPAALGDEPVSNPYKGLRPFGEDDAVDFHGREILVGELLARISSGDYLIGVVGPSGSGKSSLVRAGLIPAVRSGRLPGSDEWATAVMVPGDRPMARMEAALAGGVATGSRLLLVVDQFEEAFVLSPEPERRRFLRALIDTTPDFGVVVVVLRADFYDRPLLDREFGELFTRSIVNVTSMSALELEDAVVEPARRVGVAIDPALVARVVADVVDEPGALPLFQYALTELFDRRAGSFLSLDDYSRVGGVSGALTAQATELYAGVDTAQRDVVRQVFLRLVQITPGGPTRRRAPVRELLDLQIDPVAIQDVLARFGSHRLLTFDHDAAFGGATVEVAHEALLEEWGRLRGWLEDQREDLRRHQALAAAVAEWETAGRNGDYLLTGDRLQRYGSWRADTSIQLTDSETTFLDASLERQRQEEAEALARHQRERALARRARGRLWGLGIAVAALVGLLTFVLLKSLPDPAPDVAVLFDGTADAGYGDLFVAGVERASRQLDGRFVQRFFTPGSVEQDLEHFSEAGVPLIVMPATFNRPVRAVARSYPRIHYVVIDDHDAVDLPNYTRIQFAEHEGSFLVGAVAGLTTETGTVGFVGGMDLPIIRGFEAGFVAGAQHVNPEVRVEAVYLTPYPDLSGFSSPTLGYLGATRLYEAGADVVFHASGGSGLGVFEAAADAGDAGSRRIWAIGVDQDQYRAVGQLGPDIGVDSSRWQRHLLTSMVKRVDVAIFTVMAEHLAGSLEPGGVRSFGLAEGGVDYATSGGFIDELVPRLEELRRSIVQGRIAVPSVPSSPPPFLADPDPALLES